VISIHIMTKFIPKSISILHLALVSLALSASSINATPHSHTSPKNTTKENPKPQNKPSQATSHQCKKLCILGVFLAGAGAGGTIVYITKNTQHGEDTRDNNTSKDTSNTKDTTRTSATESAEEARAKKLFATYIKQCQEAKSSINFGDNTLMPYRDDKGAIKIYAEYAKTTQKKNTKFNKSSCREAFEKILQSIQDTVGKQAIKEELKFGNYVMYWKRDFPDKNLKGFSCNFNHKHPQETIIWSEGILKEIQNQNTLPSQQLFDFILEIAAQGQDVFGGACSEIT
ncbi:MAG: hypothetical protein AAF380_02660, partial [Bacteroidota bacterium]